MFVMLFTDSTESGSGSSVLTASSEMCSDDGLSIFRISRQVFEAWNQTKTKQNKIESFVAIECRFVTLP